MKTELLILRNDSGYFRVTGGDYTPCGLDKASVFPLERLTEVEHHRDILREKGFTGAAVHKLIIREEPLS